MTEPVRPEDMRVSDVGRLDLTEFDERPRAVRPARTRGGVGRTTADLPERPTTSPTPSPTPPAARRCGS